MYRRGGGQFDALTSTDLNSTAQGNFDVLSSIVAVRTRSEVLFTPYKLPVHAATCTGQTEAFNKSMKPVYCLYCFLHALSSNLPLATRTELVSNINGLSTRLNALLFRPPTLIRPPHSPVQGQYRYCSRVW